jgi:hypothetical protein
MDQNKINILRRIDEMRENGDDKASIILDVKQFFKGSTVKESQDPSNPSSGDVEINLPTVDESLLSNIDKMINNSSRSDMVKFARRGLNIADSAVDLSAHSPAKGSTLDEGTSYNGDKEVNIPKIDEDLLSTIEQMINESDSSHSDMVKFARHELSIADSSVDSSSHSSITEKVSESDKILDVMSLGPQIDWPDRTDFSMPYIDFMSRLYRKFRNSYPPVVFQDSKHSCSADIKSEEEQPKKNQKSYREMMLQSYIHPDAPYHGLLLNHEVGTGKTRMTLGILGNFNQRYNIKKGKKYTQNRCLMIWITTIAAKRSVQRQNSDFFAFHGDEGNTTNPFAANAKTSMKHRHKQIALFTYQEFRNVLNYVFGYSTGKQGPVKGTYSGNDKFGDWMLERGKKYYNGDAFGNTVIVLDEAHKIFEDNNGYDPDQEEWYYKRMANDSYESGREHNHVPCKWLLLTATPVPTFVIPRGEGQVAETAGGPLAPFKLLNLLIDKEDDKLPVEEEKFEKIKDGKYFANKVRGLISYFNPVDNWTTVFAPLYESPKQIQLDNDVETRIKTKLNTTCAKAAKAGDQKRLRLGQCYRRRLHWLGNNIIPACEGKSKPKTGQKCPDGIKKSGGFINKKTDEPDLAIVPRVKALVDNIKDHDNSDRGKYGKTFKHIIYSSWAYRTADIYATALEMSGFKVMDPKDRIKELKLEFREKSADNSKWSSDINLLKTMKDVEFRKGADSSDFEKNVLGSNVVFYMENNMKVADLGIMQKIFNDHKLNNYGQIARIVILGSNRKEAISLFDVKYMHIMEPQGTKTDVTQIVGRARRRCGHTGLPMNERRVKYFTYKLVFNRGTLKLAARESSDPDKMQPAFGEIAYAAVQVDPEIQAQLLISETILQWIQWSAIDSIFINNPITSDEAVVPDSKFIQSAIENDENGTWYMLGQTKRGKEISELLSVDNTKKICDIKTPQDCTVIQLRQICAVNGLSKSGNRQALLQRCSQPEMIMKWKENPNYAAALPQKVAPGETKCISFEKRFTRDCPVKDLKEICKSQQKKVTGKKQELAERCVQSQEDIDRWLASRVQKQVLPPPVSIRERKASAKEKKARQRQTGTQPSKCTSFEARKKCTVPELKKICRANNEKVGGKKDVLLERCAKTEEQFNKWLQKKSEPAQLPPVITITDMSKKQKKGPFIGMEPIEGSLFFPKQATDMGLGMIPIDGSPFSIKKASDMGLGMIPIDGLEPEDDRVVRRKEQKGARLRRQEIEKQIRSLERKTEALHGELIRLPPVFMGDASSSFSSMTPISERLQERKTSKRMPSFISREQRI